MRSIACCVLLVVLLLPVNLRANARDETLWHYRNLGKAFYENSATQYEAVEMFKKALELAQEQGRFTIPKTSPTRPKSGMIWPHPVVANGKLFVRDYEHLYCRADNFQYRLRLNRGPSQT